jgi:hypothetical protein
MKDQWEVTENKYPDSEISRYRRVKLSDDQADGVKALRGALREVSARLLGFSFKTSICGNVLWVKMMRANHGTQETIASAKANLSILDDALKMAPDAFRERLEKFLRQSGFEI